MRFSFFPSSEQSIYFALIFVNNPNKIKTYIFQHTAINNNKKQQRKYREIIETRALIITTKPTQYNDECSLYNCTKKIQVKVQNTNTNNNNKMSAATEQQNNGDVAVEKVAAVSADGDVKEDLKAKAKAAAVADDKSAAADAAGDAAAADNGTAKDGDDAADAADAAAAAPAKGSVKGTKRQAEVSIWQSYIPSN